MKNFINEFKEFALKGNAFEMAVGIIIGAAFTAIVTSLVDDIISPLIGLFVKVDFNNLVANVMGVDIKYGAFIMAIINFLIVALVLFCMIKSVNKAGKLAKRGEEEEEAPTTKVCPYCKSEIAIDATRCPNCTSELSE
ncbi:MAG: large conductance mechanosensitive channel protein MscL [Bacillota bacterium]|nr:large conductance mechanosensitive channel protein MscL [Bacillota bacterium]